MSRPRIVFAGTPEFAAICLEKLISENYQILAVYTQPDRKAGRGKKLQPSPVKQVALKHNIPVEQPVDFKQDESIRKLQAYQADLMIVVAYGLLLPTAVLDAPRLGCVNVHASLLPRWRGAAPIQRAIEAGDERTGIAIMQMDKGLDTGPVWATQELSIKPDETGSSLHDRLAKSGAEALVTTLPTILNQKEQPLTQSTTGVTYAHKLQKQEAQINWSQPATVIERKVRAFNSWPVAFFIVDGNTVRVWQATVADVKSNSGPGTILEASKNGIVVCCGEQAIKITELQAAGSRRMSVQDLLNSRANWFKKGSKLQ